MFFLYSVLSMMPLLPPSSTEKPPHHTDPTSCPAMPLFRASGELRGGAKARPGERRLRKIKFKGRSRKTDEGGSVLSLTRLCLLSLADNMKEVWVKDYADNYLDHYSFRHIMGPFNLLREFVRAYLTDNDHTFCPSFVIVAIYYTFITTSRLPHVLLHVYLRCDFIYRLTDLHSDSSLLILRQHLPFCLSPYLSPSL